MGFQVLCQKLRQNKFLFFTNSLLIVKKIKLSSIVNFFIPNHKNLKKIIFKILAILDVNGEKKENSPDDQNCVVDEARAALGVVINPAFVISKARRARIDDGSNLEDLNSFKKQDGKK